MSEGSTYLHGTSPEERARLALINGLLNDEALGALGDVDGLAVLEMGSGTGVLALRMAEAGARVVAVERSPEQLASARAADPDGRVDWRSGDAVDPPLADDELASFDLVHARFLLEHLREPARAVRAMARAVRPGGRVVLADDDHDLFRLWPECPPVARAWELYWRSYDAVGNDPLVGRKLPALLAGAGLVVRRAFQATFGACAGDPRFPAVVENFGGVLRSSRAQIERDGGYAPGEFDAMLDDFARWASVPGAALWYPVALAIGQREAGGGASPDGRSFSTTSC